MAYIVQPSPQEIDAQLDLAADYENAGQTALSGMTYEQGVQAGIRWVIGDETELPIQTSLD